jgi:20S proteasome alpha/beta subunit
VDSNRTFCVYTIDPSGAWQSWGSGITAIGKYAKIVQEQLAKKRQINSALTQPKSLREALEHVLDCWVETCMSQNVVMRQEEEDYQVLVLHKNTGSYRSSAGDVDCQLYMVDDDEVRKIVSERMNALSVKSQGS